MERRKFFYFPFFIFGSFVALQAQKVSGNEVITVVNGERLNQGDHKIFYGAAMLENQRGSHGKAAYPNQDRAVICSLLGRTACVVCDGHGKDGDLVSEKISSLLPIEVCKYRDLSYGFETGIAKLQKALTNQKYAQESGTTCVAAVIVDNKLTVANVGDSRLVVVRSTGATNPIVLATKDHKLTESQEINRIKNTGGFIEGKYVYGNKSTMGLALSRSLGDILAHDGDSITAQPDIVECLLEHGDFIVLASDGLWDVVTNNEVKEQIAGTVHNAKLTADLCSTLANKLVQLARNKKSVDDITCVVLRYQQS